MAAGDAILCCCAAVIGDCIDDDIENSLSDLMESGDPAAAPIGTAALPVAGDPIWLAGSVAPAAAGELTFWCCC